MCTIPMKAQPIVLYLVYVRPPIITSELSSQHYELINTLVNEYGANHQIMVIGDFNLPNIEWILDENAGSYLPSNILVHRYSDYFEAAADFRQRCKTFLCFRYHQSKTMLQTC